MFLAFLPPDLLMHLIKLIFQYKNDEKLEKELHNNHTFKYNLLYFLLFNNKILQYLNGTD